MAQTLPPLLSPAMIRQRLESVFPEGIENRQYVIREIAARTVFVMMYVGAIEGAEIWIRPDQVTKMSNLQAKRTDAESRLSWAKTSISPGKMKSVRGRWYAPNTREPIRDETLRSGLVYLGAVVERQSVAPTSSKPRYALNAEFASLFSPELAKAKFEKLSKAWQETHLSVLALARVRLRKRGATAAAQGRIIVSFPDGTARQMSAGPSSVLSKAVIEQFPRRFLAEPAVLFLSESGNKVVAEDLQLAQGLGIRIVVERNLPDIILMDIAPGRSLIVFIEAVVTDGAITPPRHESLLDVAAKAGIPKDRVRFVSAFEDRASAAFRRLAGELAWGTFAWFASEPDHLVHFIDRAVSLHRLE